MNKRKLHHWLTLIRRIHFTWLLAFCLVMSLLSLLALRANNQRMIELRAAVFAADEKNGDVETSLRELRQFVHGHMNTNLSAGANAIKPPIQLKFRYERLAAAEKARVKEANSKIYIDAQATCEQQIPTGFSGSNRLECIEAYVDQNGTKEKPVSEDFYKFDFVSPSWSPDLAGWSIVLAVLSLILFIFRLLSEIGLKHELKKHM